MSLRFILGRAGAGKTHTCLEEIRARALADPDGPPLVLLVPEQATFAMEQALLTGGLKGMIRAQVLSFKRLAWRVSMKAGGLADPPLTDLGKRMVLRALLQHRQGQLRLFSQVADRPGFIEKLAGTISELRQHQTGPEGLRRQLQVLEREGQGDTALGAKLHDLALIMTDLKEYTTGRFTDPDDYLTVLAERLPGSGVLSGADVWADSFTGFTPQELAVLGAIFRAAGRVHVSLCLSPADLWKAGGRHDESDLFHPTLATYDQLTELAAEHGVTMEPPLLLGGATARQARFATAPDLAHLERQFGRSVPEAWEKETPSITLVQAQHRREEVESAALEVLRLVRDEGFRFREISVVVRNLEAYGDLTATVFAEYGIPSFIDRRRTVAHHPLVELLRAACECVIQDWEYGAVFRYLKTDLTPVERHEVDQLENYVLEHGIRGRIWHDGTPWQFVRRYTLEEENPAPSDGHLLMLERINRIRDRATRELAALQRRLGGSRRQRGPLTVRSISTALFQLLDELKIARRLEEWSGAAEHAGELEVAREHEQVWDGVLELLDQMVEGLGDTEMGLPEYLQVLSAGLDGLKLGLIPPGLDHVSVGSVERSRHFGVRASLILGATEKDFPPMPAEDVIFNDRERKALDESGLTVGPTSLLRLFQEQFFTYVALTRGSHRLWFSYPLADEAGRAMTPAVIMRWLGQAFPHTRPRPALGGGPLATVATPGRLAAAMVQAFRAHRSGYPLDPVWLELYRWAAYETELRHRIGPVMAALAYEETFRRRSAPIGRELALELYGLSLETSVSRLEAFAACPFLHFAAHGLRLQERGRFALAAPELGLFYHAALSLFVRGLQAEGLDWRDLPPEDVIRRMDGLVEQLAPRLQSEVLLSTPANRYVLHVLRRTLQASLAMLGHHVQGGFRPLWVELPFGPGAEGGLPPVEVALDEGGLVSLRGRIDRVDGLQRPDGTWLLRVLDYKSSPKRLDLGRIYHGMTLQLLLYLSSVVEGAGALLPGSGVAASFQPAGALYFPVHDPVERLLLPVAEAEAAERRRKLYKATGLVLADPEVVRAMDRDGLGLTQASFRKDGSFTQRSPVATPEQFHRLFTHVREVVARCASSLLKGEVAVAPYRLAAETPCPTCRFRSVCQFDSGVEGQGYRKLDLLSPGDVWTRLLKPGGEPHE